MGAMTGVWIVIGVTAALTACIGYVVYYHVRYGFKAATPVEAWLVAKRECKTLDAELAKILSTPENR